MSSIFNHQGLEELYLDNGKFEINFDKIKENPSLRVLGLRNMELHKNYYVESYGGMTSVWYDDVKLGNIWISCPASLIWRSCTWTATSWRI